MMLVYDNFLVIHLLYGFLSVLLAYPIFNVLQCQWCQLVFALLKFIILFELNIFSRCSVDPRSGFSLFYMILISPFVVGFNCLQLHILSIIVVPLFNLLVFFLLDLMRIYSFPKNVHLVQYLHSELRSKSCKI